MFRFLHAADIHLDSPLHKLDYYEGAPAEEFRQATRRALGNLVQTAISEEVAFVLIAGDLYDGDWKDYNTGLYLVSQMARLHDAGIPVFIVAGNHDAASKITKTLRLPDGVTLFASDRPETIRIDSLNVAVHGQSFASPAVKKDLSQSYPNALKGCFNVGLLHTCASGREGHEPYAPCSLEGLQGKGYDYWALGHVHQREVLLEDPPIVFSGNTQGRHPREIGPKGCMMVTVDDDGRPRLEFRPLDVVRWVTAEVDATGAVGGYDVVDRFGQRLEALLEENEGMPLAARTIIKGETAAHSEILSDVERWSNEIRAAAMETGGGRIWVEKIRFKIAAPSSDRAFRHIDGAMGELSDLLDELRVDPDTRRELATELADLEKKVPRELKEGSDGIRFDDAEWLGNLLEQVRPMLIERLLRKGATE